MHLTPQERENRTQKLIVEVPVRQITEDFVEQIAAVPVPQITEDIVEVTQHVPQKRVPNPFVEQIGGVPVPKITEDIVEMTHVPQERVHHRVGEQIGGLPVPQINKGIVEMTQHVPQERERVVDQIGCVPVPKIMKGIVEMTQCAPHERERVVDQIGCVPVSKIKEDVVDGIRVVPQERVPQLRKKRVFLDWPRRPASQPNTGNVKCIGKVFTVKMRHRRGDQACPVDTAGLNIKGLDKHSSMPQSGDVVVPVPQIQEQIVDVGGQEQVIVREIPEVLVVERTQEHMNDRYLEDVKRAFADWGER